jgi:predicted DNA-binding ribbon-helix-helix protein
MAMIVIDDEIYSILESISRKKRIQVEALIDLILNELGATR